MTLPVKEIFYDWFGANAWLFEKINAVHGDFYDRAMLLLSDIGDHHHFMPYLIALAAWSALGLGIGKVRGKGGARHYIAAWLGVFAVLAAGYAA
ncbi:MAG: hypothetical protein KGJ06_09500, partial [Pseudomonadota bacterium]|nr:hypothetical protein [Pseudomonadota bacterium]